MKKFKIEPGMGSAHKVLFKTDAKKMWEVNFKKGKEIVHTEYKVSKGVRDVYEGTDYDEALKIYNEI